MKHKAHQQDEKMAGVADDGISIQSKVLEFTKTGYWKNLYYWSNFSLYSSPVEKALALKASALEGLMKISLEKDWRKLLDISITAVNEGFRLQK